MPAQTVTEVNRPGFPGLPASVRLRVLPGVWRPHNDAWLLARLVADRGWAAGSEALDVFTGSGVLAVSCALAGARAVTAIDISRRAVLTAALNARRNGVPVRTLRGNLFAPVADEQFDLIVANPPYYPGPPAAPRSGIARAWAGGPDGRALIDAFCSGAPGFLRPGGRVLVVHGSFNGERATRDLLEARGLQTDVVLRHRGPLGAVGRAQLRDLIDTARDGEEETIIVSGVRPRS
jgi:release factor glutamine methyltransferase